MIRINAISYNSAVFRRLFGDAGLPIDNTLQCIALIDGL